MFVCWCAAGKLNFCMHLRPKWKLLNCLQISWYSRILNISQRLWKVFASFEYHREKKKNYFYSLYYKNIQNSSSSPSTASGDPGWVWPWCRSAAGPSGGTRCQTQSHIQCTEEGLGEREKVTGGEKGRKRFWRQTEGLLEVQLDPESWTPASLEASSPLLDTLLHVSGPSWSDCVVNCGCSCGCQLPYNVNVAISSTKHHQYVSLMGFLTP